MIVAPVVRQDVPLYIEAVSALDGYVDAEIRARVRGVLQAQRYKDGATVQKGQLLFTIDPSEFGIRRRFSQGGGGARRDGAVAQQGAARAAHRIWARPRS